MRNAWQARLAGLPTFIKNAFENSKAFFCSMFCESGNTKRNTEQGSRNWLADSFNIHYSKFLVPCSLLIHRARKGE
jgi:hypothetical protein